MINIKPTGLSNSHKSYNKYTVASMSVLAATLLLMAFTSFWFIDDISYTLVFALGAFVLTALPMTSYKNKPRVNKYHKKMHKIDSENRRRFVEAVLAKKFYNRILATCVAATASYIAYFIGIFYVSNGADVFIAFMFLGAAFIFNSLFISKTTGILNQIVLTVFLAAGFIFFDGGHIILDESLIKQDHVSYQSSRDSIESFIKSERPTYEEVPYSF